MSSSETRSQRQAALEDRRRRIAEMREARNRRQEDTARVQASATANLEDYVTGLLREPAPGQAAAPPAPTEQTTEAPSSSSSSAKETTPIETDTAATTTTTDNVMSQAVAPLAPKKQVETFEFGTQTEDTDFVEAPEPATVEPEEDDVVAPQNGVMDKEPVQKKQAQEETQPKLLSTKEVEKEVASTPFSTFINTASKKVERMLGTPLLSDLLVDTVGEMDDGAATKKSDADGSKFVSASQVYDCPKWTAHRDITDIDWSPLHRELILSTYAAAAAATTSTGSSSTAVAAISPKDTPSASLSPRSGELQSDGLAVVYNLAMPSRPEHVFTCGSPVTAGCFHPTDACLVVGGCESGQLVVWDVRAGRLPVQKSALTSTVGASSAGHVHVVGAITAMEGAVSLYCFVCVCVWACFFGRFCC